MALLVPKNVNFLHVIEVFGECEVEQNFDEGGVMCMVTLYFGSLVRNISNKNTGPTRMDLSKGDGQTSYGYTGDV